ncbi:MAG: hypothetical protein A3A33_01715 [Candidatus Yanofskybacteria bacterium RIFCSPLOWO2_01_FULL_49_25]|uniref:Bacterial sugar transferase domain-containing protein n=1 Tax=Candidatus Yanofskybacteria bacterium RIFCSPLOWO2_01_FULL_49_25 TaxID=1802701 RepID=A0A1F8GX76_9BACT|nr:MAG: hypothetical protein A3A33_01715 [Candidatus Yanofskybacteria bacterium RIFCSPLOWO2_01_FULL_49_25]
MKKLGLFLVDVAILYLALYLTLFLRYGREIQQYISIHLVPFTIIFALWLLVFYIVNLYDIGVSKNNITFYSSYLYAMAFNAAIAIAFFYLTPSIEIAPRRNLFVFLAFSGALLFAWRWLFNVALVRAGIGNNTLIIGNSQHAGELYDFLLANPQLGYNALGMLNVRDAEAIAILERLILQKRIRTLVLDPEAYKIPDIIDILYRLLPLKMNFHALPDFYERVTGKVLLGTIDQSWFINNLSEGSKRIFETLTRIADVISSVLFGIVSFIGYPFVIIGIKMTSAGPIFIRQKRVGHAGKIFTLIKFRSMIADNPTGSAEGKTGPTWTQKNDPRITRFGKFLRKTRIDEWPQVWNILVGDMSWVGPRAERPEFHEQLKKEIPFYEERYIIKPGITGLSQLIYGYGSSVKDAEEKLKYDLYYVKNRSFLLNVSILLKTINLIVRQAGR